MTTNVGSDQAGVLEQILRDLATLTIAQLKALWQQYKNEPEILAVLQTAVPEVVAPYTAAASEVTAQWYNELAPEAPFKAASLASPIAPEKIDGTIKWALYAPGKSDPLERLSGASTRWVYDASRETVVQNAETEVIGYVRHAQPDACAFCRLLCTRTETLYRSEKSALRVVGRGKEMTAEEKKMWDAGETRGSGGRFMAQGVKTRGKRQLGDKFHDFCRCTAVPVREGTIYVPPPYVADWTQEYNDAWDAVPDGTSYQDNGVLKAVLAQMRSANETNKR
jgi:hypothetical protein